MTSAHAALRVATAAAAPRVGLNSGAWRGVTVHRFPAPQAPQWASAHSLSLYCVVQGALNVTVGGTRHRCGQFEFLLLTAGMRFEAEVIEATATDPCLGFLVQLDGAQARRLGAALAADGASPAADPPAVLPAVSAVDEALADAFVRLLRVCACGRDREFLLPLRRREVTYRVVRSEQGPRLLAAAAAEHQRELIAEIVEYVGERIAEPHSVEDLAARACLSRSAFARLFRDVTGVAPWQFVKSMRMDRARELLEGGGRSVAEVAGSVGFADAAYFSVEFRRHFGTSPHSYSRAQRGAISLRVESATRRHDS